MQQPGTLPDGRTQMQKWQAEEKVWGQTVIYAGSAANLTTAAVNLAIREIAQAAESAWRDINAHEGEYVDISDRKALDQPK